VEGFLAGWRTTTTNQAVAFEEVQAVTRRRRLRIWLPVAVVAILLAALIGNAIHEFRVMRADALALSEGVIGNLQSRIETEVGAYLGPIPGIVRFTRDLLADQDLLSVRRELAEKVASGILDNTPQLTSVFIGSPAGEFFMVRRYQEGEQRGLETKTIRRPHGAKDAPVMQLTRHGAKGEVLSDEQAPWDGYDPRARPWFVGAAKNEDLFWTDVYLFFTTSAAGITASVPYLNADGELVAVVGTDVELASLSRFLATLSIGDSGLALIVDDQGRVMAHPRKPLVTKDGGGELRLLRVDDIGDPVVSRAFDRYRVEGHGRHDFEVAGRRYISSTSSLSQLLPHDWSILMIVPEDDFVGFVAENVRDTLGMGLAVIALAGGLAGLVVRQGLRADQEAIDILERQAQLDAQGEAFGMLATQSTLFEDSGTNGLALVTEAVARSSRVRRASLWHLAAAGDALVCLDSFDQQTEGHTDGATLDRSEHPGLFEWLQNESAVSDVASSDDARLVSLYRSYLSPLGCEALLSVPVKVDGQVTGVLWLEDGRRSEWPNQVQRFARAIGNLMAIRQAAGATAGAVVAMAPAGKAKADDSEAAPRTEARVQELNIDARLGARRTAAFAAKLPDGPHPVRADDVQRIDQLAFVSLRFSDALALARSADDRSGESTIARLLAQIDAAASKHGVAYLKFLTDRVVAAADPAADVDHATVCLAEFALAAQAACERLFAEQHAPSAFHLGMDLGPAIGSLIDRKESSLNLWGEAARMAYAMADSAPPGTIHTTESVYEALHDRYLFQLRGHHYLEDVGEFSTYLLGGRL
jgi:adenylate cyclase